MRRQEIENIYEIGKNGIITTPGRFQGEHVYAPYFHELSEDNQYCQYVSQDGTKFLLVYWCETFEFPEIPRNTAYMMIRTNSNGNVLCLPVSDAVLETHKAFDTLFYNIPRIAINVVRHLIHT